MISYELFYFSIIQLFQFILVIVRQDINIDGDGWKYMIKKEKKLSSNTISIKIKLINKHDQALA